MTLSRGIKQIGYGAGTLDINDYDAARPIIISFQPGAGGKFLANCLGLSQRVMLQDIELVKQQLRNDLPPVQKFKLLTARMPNKSPQWRDLELGDRQFTYVDMFAEWFPAVAKQHLPFPEEYKQMIAEKYLFCHLAHTPNHVKMWLDLYPHARVVQFVNNNNFMTKHRPNWLPIYKYHDQIQKLWFQQPSLDRCVPPTYVEDLEREPWNHFIKHFDPQTLAILKNYLPIRDFWKVRDQVLLQQVKDICDAHLVNLWFWQGDWYLDKTKTMIELAKIYHAVELFDFDYNLLSKFYDHWIKSI